MAVEGRGRTSAAHGRLRTVTEPLAAGEAPADLLPHLRAEVGLLRAEEQRRVFPVRVALGIPGHRGPGTVVSGPVAPLRGSPWPPGAWLDAGTRFDVVDRLVGAPWLDRDRGVHAWLLRPGVPSVHDEDLAWLAATRQACAAHDLEAAGFWVVTRYGWLDPASGDSRQWRRLRVRR
jgi:hypothetical protein